MVPTTLALCFKFPSDTLRTRNDFPLFGVCHRRPDSRLDKQSRLSAIHRTRILQVRNQFRRRGNRAIDSVGARHRMRQT
jgi:hypothetical protein